MSYEYGTGQQGLDYPNPYRIENIVLMIRSGIFTVSAIILLFMAKSNLDDNNYINLVINLLAATGFIYGTLSTGYRITKQLRVYFGRGQPNGLAHEWGVEQEGSTESSQKLRETIRHGALVFAAPQGGLNGILYAYFKNLIVAPQELKNLTHHIFSNIVKLLIVLAMFALSSFFTIGSSTSGWLGLYFFIVTFFLILRSVFKEDNIDTRLSLNAFWSLFACSLIVPIGLIVLSKYHPLPDISQWNFGMQSFFIVIFTIIGELLAFRALYLQLDTPTGITTAYEQDSISFNAPPAQINLEIERKLQNEWIAAIPNRSYAKQTPHIGSNKSGHFTGQIIQETQPMVPHALEGQQDLNKVLARSRTKMLFIIDMLSLSFNVFATIGILYALFSMQSDENPTMLSLVWLPLFIRMLVLSVYWIKITHNLWGRFDFESKVYVFEYEGNYSTASMNFGNQFKDTIQSKKDIVNIESMTLRVWVTHMRTVVFGHGIDSENNPRRILSMIGLKDESRAWVQHLREFATNQSMMLLPNQNEDMARLASLSQMNAIASASTEHQKNVLLEQYTSQLPQGQIQPPVPNILPGPDHQ